MNIQEILSEAYVHPEIKKILLSKGYKYLAKGVDQMVFLEPGTGLILKIFGTSAGKSGSESELTNAQKTFKTFYDVLKADPNNPFLPNIIEYAPFMFKNKPYLQIRMERLFEFTGNMVDQWKHVLADMTVAIEHNRSFNDYWDDASKPVTKTQPIYVQASQATKRGIQQQVIMHLGEEGLRKLWNTIIMLKKVAKKNGYVLDLHQGNFMLNSDSDPVISDPFFMGWSKST